MKIRVLMLSDDKVYLKRISSAFSKYSSSIEMYIFDNLDSAYKCLDDVEIDVLICEKSFDIDKGKVSPYCAFAYFVDDSSVSEIDGAYAVGKYQSVDSLYKKIIDLYSDVSGKIVEKQKNSLESQGCKKILFTSFSGGVGASSMAAAAAIASAAKGNRTLYLSLEEVPITSQFFKSDSDRNFSNVIYALKSDPNKNIQLKLDSLVSQDKTGVFFFKETDSAIDMNELSWDNINNLIEQLVQSESYDVIIVDRQFHNDEKSIYFADSFDQVVIVCSGEKIGNYKSSKAIEIVKLFERSKGLDMLSKMVLVYNMFSNKTGKEMTAGNLRDLGGVPRLEHASSEEVVKFIVNRNLFETLF